MVNDGCVYRIFGPFVGNRVFVKTTPSVMLAISINSARGLKILIPPVARGFLRVVSNFSTDVNVVEAGVDDAV